MYKKYRSEAIEILWKCEKNVEGIKNFLPKRFKNDINEDQKRILLNGMKLFDTRNAIVGLFKNVFIKSSDFQSAAKIEQKSKSEESLTERTKLRKQKLNEIAKNKKEINLEFFGKYLNYSSPVDMYKSLNESINTARNKIEVNLIKSILTDLKKDTENMPKDNANKTEENTKIIDIVERILYFNEEN